MDLRSYSQNALTLLERLVYGVQTWARAPGGALVAAGAAAVGALSMLICLTLLLIRARRETRKCRAELANLLALRKAAESANNISAEFLTSMMHRIRTPVHAIVGFIDLAWKTDFDPELRERLDTVRTSADWLMHIANDALEFSCIEAGGLPLDNGPFSISECILSAIKIVEREASAKDLVTGCKIDPQLPEVVCGDPTRFRHVIFNLLHYAVRSTASGTIILSAALESNSADSVLVRVAITDTGVGIPPATRPLISEPFGYADVSAALKSDPTGFGLVISRRLVDLMGGTMEAQSQLGAASMFEFTVRFQKQKTAEELDAPVPAPASVEQKTLSILVAEDNAMNRRLITKVLESAGHRIWTAANGKEAVQSVQNEGFDLILMDVEMPDMDGLESTRAIRAAEAPNLHVPIYALTAHASPGDRDRCLAAGMDGFVTKPIAMDELLQLVSKLVAAETKDIAIESLDNAFTPKYVEQEVTSNEDFGESSLTLEASLHNLQNFALNTAGEPYISGGAATSSTDSLHGDDGFSDATSPAFDAEIIGVLASIEDSYGNSDDHGPAASALLSAPAGLALLEATCQLTQPSPSLMKQDDGPTATAACDPFEQARKSLSKSSFGIRVIHNDGDPSDRNLI